MHILISLHNYTKHICTNMPVCIDVYKLCNHVFDTNHYIPACPHNWCVMEHNK